MVHWSNISVFGPDIHLCVSVTYYTAMEETTYKQPLPLLMTLQHALQCLSVITSHLLQNGNGITAGMESG